MLKWKINIMMTMMNKKFITVQTDKLKIAIERVLVLLKIYLENTVDKQISFSNFH